MNLQEIIRKILREEIKMPLQLKRRVNNDILDELIYTVKSLIDSGYDESDAIYDTVRQFIASKQFKLNHDSEQSYWDSYIKVEEPLVNYLKSKLNIRESVIQEETNPTLRKLLRRGSPENIDRIFEMGLYVIADRYIENKKKLYSQTLSAFRYTVINYVIVELCTTYEDVCTGGDFYEQTSDFLMNNYSDRIKEKWEEINS